VPQRPVGRAGPTGLVSTLTYSGPRPEEVVYRLTWDDVGEQAIRYVETGRHRTRHTPLLKPVKDDLNEWFLASGRPTGICPVFPGPRRRLLAPGRLAQLAQTNLAGRARAAPPGPQEPDPSPRGLRAGRSASARPTLELPDAPRVRRDPAHPDRPRGRNQRSAHRAVLAGVIANWDGKQTPRSVDPPPPEELMDGTAHGDCADRDDRSPANPAQALCRIRTDGPFLTMTRGRFQLMRICLFML